MNLRLRTALVATAAAGVAFAGVAASPALAASANPATGQTETISGTFSGSGTFGGVPITLTCNVSGTGTLGTGNKITFPASKPPQFSNCSDSLGGTDTVTAFGKWSGVVGSSAAPTKATIKIPINGATFTSSLDSSCVVTVAPTKAQTIHGKYVKGTTSGTATFKNQPVSVSPSSGCPGGTGTSATINSTLTITPAV